MWNNRKQQLAIYEDILSKDKYNMRYVNACCKLKERMKRFAKYKISEMTLEQRKEYNNLYYQSNKERIKENQRIRHSKNKERIIEYRKAYYNKNKEKMKNNRRIYYSKNKEKIKEQRKQKRRLINYVL